MSTKNISPAAALQACELGCIHFTISIYCFESNPLVHTLIEDICGTLNKLTGVTSDLEQNVLIGFFFKFLGDAAHGFLMCI
jgi:hypothetical protein